MLSTKINTLVAHGTHTFSEATSLLGGIASVVVRHSSQTEKQFLKLQKMLHHFTKHSSPAFRLDVITYGEAQFWNKPAPVSLDSGIARIVDNYVARAKAA